MKQEKFSTADILVPITMKNAANCEKQCELQNRESSGIRTQLAPIGNSYWYLSFSVLDHNKRSQCDWRFLLI
jgi:hypothetical protein